MDLNLKLPILIDDCSGCPRPCRKLQVESNDLDIVSFDFNDSAYSDEPNYALFFPNNQLIWSISMDDTEKIVSRIRFNQVYKSEAKLVMLCRPIYSSIPQLDKFIPLSRCSCGMFKIMISIIKVDKTDYYRKHLRPYMYFENIIKTYVKETYKVCVPLKPFSLTHISAAVFLRNSNYYGRDVLDMFHNNRFLVKRFERMRFQGKEDSSNSWRYWIMMGDPLRPSKFINPYCCCIYRKHSDNECSNDMIKILFRERFGQINGHLLDCDETTAHDVINM